MLKKRKIKAKVLPVGIGAERLQLYFFVEEEKYGKVENRFHLGGLILFPQEMKQVVQKLEELDFIEILGKGFLEGKKPNQRKS